MTHTMTSPPTDIRIGTAGWAIPRAIAEQFPAEGSGLVRYAAQLNAVEINTTFHRPHRASTFARWAEAPNDDMRLVNVVAGSAPPARTVRSVATSASMFWLLPGSPAAVDEAASKEGSASSAGSMSI